MSAPAKKHALLSPSSAHRWLNCRGALAMEQGEPNETTEDSAKGTAKHFLSAHCLTTKTHASAYIGKTIYLDAAGDESFSVTPDVKWTFLIDAGFAGNVNAYVQRLLEYAEGNDLMIEQSLSIEHMTGEEGASGTGDGVIITADGKELQVHDAKFGHKEVIAEENEQLMMYAAAAVEQFSLLGEFERVLLVIHQPPLGKVSEWACSIEDLKYFERGVQIASGSVRGFLKGGLPETMLHDALVPGDKQCGYCKAKHKCPALDNFVQDAIGAEFEVIAEVGKDAKHEVIATPIDNTTLGLKNKAVPLIEKWCEAISAKVKSELVNGNAVPGFKLVKGRQGNRAWKNEADAEASMKSMRLKQEEMYTYKVISPTQAEELLAKEKPRRWKTLQALIVRSDGQPSVAPESDKRPALVIKPLSEEFQVIDEEEESLA